jgi:hypothetical protein
MIIVENVKRLISGADCVEIQHLTILDFEFVGIIDAQVIVAHAMVLEDQQSVVSQRIDWF